MYDNYQILLDEVRQIFASVVWTHKIQEKQADIYATQYKILNTINIITSTATSCGIITTIFFNEFIAKFVTACISFVALSTTAYLKIFDLKNMENNHRIAANKFVIIRNQLLHIIAELHMCNDINIIKYKYEHIIKDLDNVFLSSPSTTSKAVDVATEALNKKNEYTYTNDEIDHFLPFNLKGGIR